MADAFTSTSSSGLDQEAWDRLAYFDFRANTTFVDLCDVKPTNQSMPGRTVTFTKINDLDVVTSTLSETTDVDAVAIGDAQVTLTLGEYGNATLTTALLSATSFIALDPVVATVLGANAGQSMDIVHANVAAAGSNVEYAGTNTGRATIAATDKITAHDVRVARAQLTGASVPKFNSQGGGSYGAVIHPDVVLDLEEETGAAGWREAHIYAAPQEIFNGELGKFQGFRFIETPNLPLFADAGAGNVDVYPTLFLGKQGLARAYSAMYGDRPRIVAGPVTDKLRRFQPMGWYYLGAVGRFREESIRRFESASSIGANA